MKKRRVVRTETVGRRTSSVSALHPKRFAHALGMLALIAVVFFALFAWFGGFEGSDVTDSFPIGFSFHDWTFIFGLMQAYVIWYIAGWIFARIYNRGV